MVEEAASRGADGGSFDVAVLPEMCTSGFSMNPAIVAEAPGGESSSALESLSKEHGIHIIVGIAELDPETNRGRNTAQVFSPTDGLIASYTKARSFAYSGEDKHYDDYLSPLRIRINMDFHNVTVIKRNV